MMEQLRAWSITASSCSLVLSIVAAAFGFHSEWYRTWKSLGNHPSWWKSTLDLAAFCITAVGSSVSLLACSVVWNEKGIGITLLVFGRFLLVRQVWFLWRVLRRIQSHISTAFRWIPWVVLVVAICCGGVTVFTVWETALSQHHEAIVKLSLIILPAELLGISVTHVYLLIVFRSDTTVGLHDTAMFGDLRDHMLGMACGASLIGCLVTSITFFVKVGHPINWLVALWIQVATGELWLIRSVLLGISEFLAHRRERKRTSDGNTLAGIRTRAQE